MMKPATNRAKSMKPKSEGVDVIPFQVKGMDRNTGTVEHPVAKLHTSAIGATRIAMPISRRYITIFARLIMAYDSPAKFHDHGIKS